MTDLDVDALERELLQSGALVTIKKSAIKSIIQRLREAEADRDEWKQKAWDDLAGGNIVALGMQARIAQLERVREAVIDYLGDYVDRDALNAALDAVEEK